jgi:hypothetical protein
MLLNDEWKKEYADQARAISAAAWLAVLANREVRQSATVIGGYFDASPCPAIGITTAS